MLGRRAAASLLSQLGKTSAWLEALPESAFSRQTPLPGFSVRDVTAHLVILIEDTVASLQHPTSVRPTSLDDHLHTIQHDRGRTLEQTRLVAGSESGPGLARQLATKVVDLEEALSGDQPPAIVETDVDPLRTVDLLRCALIEVVAHSDDLSRAVPGEGVPLDPQARLDVPRILAEVLERRFPGRSVELRVPPATAVQVAAEAGGPTHTRGTPPALVETDPITFVRLCTGRLGWDDAVRMGPVRASGAHADLSRMFPVLTRDR